MFAPLLAAALAAAPAADTQAVRTRPEPASVLGLALDAGLPSGAGVSLLVRPLPWLRLQAGPGTNGAGFGLRGGVTFLPLRSFLTPTLTVEAGHFFEADVSAAAETFGQLPDFGDEMLSTVSYDYASAMLGLEVGSQEGFFGFVRAGAAYVDARFGSYAIEGDDAGAVRSVTGEGPSIGTLAPSAVLGVGFYL